MQKKYKHMQRTKSKYCYIKITGKSNRLKNSYDLNKNTIHMQINT